MKFRRLLTTVPARAFALAFTCLHQTTFAAVNEVETVAPGVYFHEGDLGGKGHCNNGWIIFEDYILVVDANFPSGARVVIPKIKATSNKPIRFAFDTHHHGDHAYGNAVWVEEGAVPVAHTGVIEEMKKYETGYYEGANKPGRWEGEMKNRPDVAGSKLKPPTLLFPKQLIFDDNQKRVELHHFGVAHTRGDGFAWLPKERILFTGDACVNGPYNYMGDGDSGEWIKTLEAAKKLEPKVVCPGHGPTGGPEVLDNQIEYFRALREGVKAQMDSQKDSFTLATAVAAVKTGIQANPRIARYVGGSFQAQVAKVYKELGGTKELAAAKQIEDHARHAHHHGLEPVQPHTHPGN